MKTYKDFNNNLFAYELDGSQDSIIPEHLARITDEEAEQVRQAQLPVIDYKAIKQYEIDALEASQFMTRGERESWLTMIEAQATAQNVSLETLYLANPFYKKLKDIDNKIIILRNELIAIV